MNSPSHYYIYCTLSLLRLLRGSRLPSLCTPMYIPRSPLRLCSGSRAPARLHTNNFPSLVYSTLSAQQLLPCSPLYLSRSLLSLSAGSRLLSRVLCLYSAPAQAPLPLSMCSRCSHPSIPAAGLPLSRLSPLSLLSRCCFHIPT